MKASVSPHFIALAVLAGLLPPLPALSQSGATLEEVVVTARRREENLQETPLSVSALGAEYLESMGVSSIEDVETLTPSLQFSQTNYKAPAIFIRGIGQRSGNPVLDPGVGMYLNGVYVPRSDAQLLDAVDVANIQVLRGPQGTLFGKNNIGGALLVDSKKPNPEALEFSVKGGIGSHGRRVAKFDGNIPLIEDVLGLRFALNSKRIDGYIDNTTADNALFDEDRIAASARAIWYVSDTTEVDVFAFISRIDERGSPYNCLFQTEQAILAQAIYRGSEGTNLAEACGRSDALAKDFKVRQNESHAKYAVNNHMLAMTVRWDLAGLDAESITSWAMQDNIRTSGDSDGTGIESVQVGSAAAQAVYAGSGERAPEAERVQFTQELKFNGTAWDEALNYTFGVFYAFEELTDTLDGTDVGDNGLAAIGPQSVGLPPGLPVPNENEVLPVQASDVSLSDYKNTTGAIFAQASWDIREWLQLTVGLRYTREERENRQVKGTADYDEYANRLNAQIGSDPNITRPVSVAPTQTFVYTPVPIAQYFAYVAPEIPLVFQSEVKGNVAFSEWTPAVTLNYIATDDRLEAWGLDSFIAYITVSDGFKSGGQDVRSTQTEAKMEQFEPELVTNTEIGVKIDAFDRRLRFNMAVYQLDYENLQVALYEQGSTETEVVQFTGNAGQAVVDGFEFELTALIGNWTINANAGYTDGDFVEYDLASNTPSGLQVFDRSSEAFPQVPQNVRGLVLRYDWYSEVGLWTPQIHYYYSDELFIGTDYLSSDFDSSTVSQYETFDLRLGWEPNDRLSLSAWVSNVKNDQHFIGGISVTSIIGVANRVPGLPRHFGLDLSYKFE